ncbi:hypothetical protein VSQ32_00230 [Lachnospiraceae bacterium KK002]
MAFIDRGIYEINKDYLYYLLAGTDWSIGTNKAVMGLTLNKSTLSEKEIPLPDIRIQRAIDQKPDCLEKAISERKKQLGKLDELVKSKLAVKKSLEKLETLKKALMQQYFGQEQ